MTDAASAGALDPNEIDLSAVVEYMQRNNLSRVKLLIEAVDDPGATAPPGKVMVAERLELVDDTLPSDLGLDGAFFLVNV